MESKFDIVTEDNFGHLVMKTANNDMMTIDGESNLVYRRLDARDN